MSDRGGNIHYLQPQPDANERQLVKFRPFWVAEMQDTVTKPREWLIDGVLQRGTVLLFAGAPKIGKSLLMQQLLTAVALGQPWLDRETACARAFGLFCEDSETVLKERQEEFNIYFGREPGDFETHFSMISLDAEPYASMVDFDRYGTKPQFTDVWHQTWEHVARNDIEIVGLDNARVLFGGVETFSNQVTLFCRLLAQKAIEINGAIILAVHPPKGDAEGFAGTGAWHASVRNGISLRRPPDYNQERDGLRDPRRRLVGLGANYATGIGVEPLEIHDGVFRQVEREDVRSRPRAARGPLTDQQMLDLRYNLLIRLKKVMKGGAQVFADTDHRHSLPERAKRSHDVEINKMTRNELYRAQELMIEAGQLIVVRVEKKVLLRPNDGPYYDNEEAFILPKTGSTEVKNAAD